MLSSLYIGTGDMEKNLVDQLHSQLREKPQLKATILLDYNRGCREDKNGKSSKTILLPLLNESYDGRQQTSNLPEDRTLNQSIRPTDRSSDRTESKVSINFFLSPDFSNIILKNALLNRQKYNEIVSLQHIKVYLFDNDFIISGANLNEQYFTNRQDRYIYVRNCPQLGDYLEQLIQTIGNISMHLNSDGTFSCELDPLDERNKQTIQFRLRNEVEQLNKSYFIKNSSKGDLKSKAVDGDDSTTLIYPLLQMKKFNVNTDETFTKFIFNSLGESSKLYLASGYFNLTKDYQQSIFRVAAKRPDCSVELIMASEEVNSFYKAQGPIQHIPSIYTQLSKNFIENLNSKMLSNVSLLSYFRSNWTFHAKGLWLMNTSTSDYFLSLVGSPNFGYRSVYKDLELQMTILTKDDHLIKQFLAEYENIRKYTKLIHSPDELPSVSYWIRIVTNFVKSFF